MSGAGQRTYVLGGQQRDGLVTIRPQSVAKSTRLVQKVTVRAEPPLNTATVPIPFSVLSTLGSRSLKLLTADHQADRPAYRRAAQRGNRTYPQVAAHRRRLEQMAATGRTKRPQAAGCRHPPAKHLAGGGPSRGARLVDRRCDHMHPAQPNSVLAGYARDDPEACQPTKLQQRRSAPQAAMYH